MSRSFIKWLLGGCMLLLPLCSMAQDKKELKPWKVQRQHADYTGWQRLQPTHLKLQYAGGMGLASLGLGWDYGRSNQFETDLHVGFVPKHYSNVSRAVFTLKQNWMPWNIRCTDWLGVEPLSCGLYLTVVSGTTQNYWLSEPSKYGGPYYRFSTRARAYLYVGQRATWYNRRPDSWLDRVTLYYELSTKEMDVLAKVTNKRLYLKDIFYFSFGVKVGLNL